MSNEYLVGQKILGYELQELIGSGGFGKVYKGVKKVGKDEYYAAIKHISLPKNNEYNDLLNSMGRNYEAVDKYYEKILEDMVNEINTLFYLSKKDNKNIVTYYDHDIVKQENPLRYDIFIRMEYLKPLNIYSNEGNMTVEDAINLGIDIARALDNCHKQGIIHRDVKDGNIFISEDGHFKLGDFGISRMLSDTNQTLSMKGTPIFMAPEVILGKYYDKTVDIYSLGIVLYKLLNYNRIPFLPNYPEIYTSRDTDIAMNRRLSGEKFDNPQNASNELGQVILRACEEQGKRYGSCEDLISDLLKVKNDMSEDKLSKLLFEVNDEKSKSNKHDDLEDTYILTQNDMDDTILLEDSIEEYTDEVECIKNDNTYESYVDNSIDDTVILEYGNDVDLSESELIDDTVVISEDIDIVEESTENLKNNEENKRKNTFLKTVTIATSLCLVLGFGYFHLKNKENIEKEKARIEELKQSLPKESKNKGNLSGNYTTRYNDEISRANIVSDDRKIYYAEAKGIIKANYDGTEQEYLTDYDGVCLNKVGDEIYHIELSTNKVKRVNIKTKEIGDVYDIKSSQIITVDNYMYYNNLNDEGRLYKINLSNGIKEKIIDYPTNIYSFSISNEKALVAPFDEGVNLINLKNGEDEYLFADMGNDIALYENYIVYLKPTGLYRINIETKNEEIVLEKDYIKDFTIENEFLYYISEDCLLTVKNLISNEEYYIDEVTGDYINVSSKVIYTENEGSLYIYEFNEDNF